MLTSFFLLYRDIPPAAGPGTVPVVYCTCVTNALESLWISIFSVVFFMLFSKALNKGVSSCTPGCGGGGVEPTARFTKRLFVSQHGPALNVLHARPEPLVQGLAVSTLLSRGLGWVTVGSLGGTGPVSHGASSWLSGSAGYGGVRQAGTGCRPRSHMGQAAGDRWPRQPCHAGQGAAWDSALVHRATQLAKEGARCLPLLLWQVGRAGSGPSGKARARQCDRPRAEP